MDSFVSFPENNCRVDPQMNKFRIYLLKLKKKILEPLFLKFITEGCKGCILDEQKESYGEPEEQKPEGAELTHILVLPF